MTAEQKRTLALLDSFLVPRGRLRNDRFEYLFGIYDEALAGYTEPDPDEDEDAWGAWSDSTYKHRIFDYWPTERPKGHPNKKYWKGINDLAWVLADWIPDTEAAEALEADLVGH